MLRGCLASLAWRSSGFPGWFAWALPKPSLSSPHALPKPFLSPAGPRGKLHFPNSEGSAAMAADLLEFTAPTFSEKLTHWLKGPLSPKNRGAPHQHHHFTGTRVSCLRAQVSSAWPHQDHKTAARLSLGSQVSGLRSQASSLGSQDSGLKSRVSGPKPPGRKSQLSKSRVSGLKPQASGLRSRVSGLRAQVSGLGSHGCLAYLVVAWRLPGGCLVRRHLRELPESCPSTQRVVRELIL